MKLELTITELQDLVSRSQEDKEDLEYFKNRLDSAHRELDSLRTEVANANANKVNISPDAKKACVEMLERWIRLGWFGTNKIMAIKMMRDAAGEGLKEAKDHVERVGGVGAWQPPIQTPYIAPVKVEPSPSKSHQDDQEWKHEYDGAGSSFGHSR